MECRLLGRNAIGIELNPVGVLISRAKSAYYDQADVDAVRAFDRHLGPKSIFLDDWLRSVRPETVIPEYPRRDQWFKPEVLEELGAIKVEIEKFDCDDRVRMLLQLAFSRIIVPVSNQESETRYAMVVKRFERGHTVRLFLRVLEGYANTLESCLGQAEEGVKIRVIEGDTREALDELNTESIDFVVTSPPYINSFDYYLYNKHRIFWMGKDPREIRRREIGCHHTTDTKSYETALADYTSDLRTTFEKLHRVLKPGKNLALLVGDGIVKGRLIETDALVDKVSQMTSFRVTQKKSIPLREVSKRFIKGNKIDRKKHHIMLLQKQ